MAKFVDPSIQDLYLNGIKNTCIRMALCSAAPANYTGIAALRLAEFTMSSSDFTLSAATTGRKATVAAKSVAVTATATGTHTYTVLHDNAAVMILYQPPANPQVITTGNPVTMGSWTITLPEPT